MKALPFSEAFLVSATLNHSFFGLCVGERGGDDKNTGNFQLAAKNFLKWLHAAVFEHVNLMKTYEWEVNGQRGLFPSSLFPFLTQRKFFRNTKL